MPLADYIGASLYPQKIAASLLTVLGSLAVVLAAVGLYSVMSYSVVQRTHGNWHPHGAGRPAR